MDQATKKHDDRSAPRVLVSENKKTREGTVEADEYMEEQDVIQETGIATMKDTTNETDIDGRINEGEAHQKMSANKPSNDENRIAGTIENDFSTDGDYDDDTMPLFYYSRLYGSIPRKPQQTPPNATPEGNILESPCSCCVMGKVVLTPETTTTSNPENINTVSSNDAAMLSGSSHGRTQSAGDATNYNPDEILDLPNDDEYDEISDAVAGIDQTSLWMNESIPILGMGLQDGHVLLLDAKTGTSVLTTGSDKPFFRVREQNTGAPIAAISLDSSGTSFGAIDEGGMCCIWTLKYKIQLRKQTQPRSENADPTNERGSQAPQQDQAPAPGGNAFTNFVSAAFKWPGSQPQQQQQQQQPSTQVQPNTTNESNTSISPRNNEEGTTRVLEGENISSSTLGNLQAKGRERTGPKYVPTLTVAESKLHRVNYPKSFGKPTCIALDPAYSQKRETSLLVAFEDGKIVFSKRGWLLQRREDKFIQYTGPAGDKDFRGIEAVVWRGSIVAFADCSGVRLYDTDTFKPIAHVDRPTGARPSLYPGILVKPNLCFETSSSLLVAWGDCLLTMRIRETTVVPLPAEGASNDEQRQESGGTEPTNLPTLQSQQETPNSQLQYNNQILPKKRVVECSMAWALDCVACGIVPLDEHHVVVLGQTIPFADDDEDGFSSDDEDEENNGERYSIVRASDINHEYRPKNELELQVVSRLNGSIVYSDVLPLLHRLAPPTSTTTKTSGLFQKQATSSSIISTLPVNASYFLLSSFAVPRMENALELSEEMKTMTSVVGTSTENLTNQSQQLGGTKARFFLDSHIKWNLQMVTYDNAENAIVQSVPVLKNRSTTDDDNDDNGDADSTDSDDYDFVLRPKSTKIGSESIHSDTNATPSPPVIVIVSNADAVVGRVRDIDDAISYTLEQRKKPALALRMAIQNLTSIRRHNISDLVNYYFRALLRVGGTAEEIDIADVPDRHSSRQLSLRRLKLAAKAMPILFGANVDVWEYWLSELEHVPGALFVARNYLPVRDPKLPPRVYANVLSKMLEQVESIQQNDSASSSSFGVSNSVDPLKKAASEAENQFLNSLLAWGATETMLEYLKLYQYQAKFDNSFDLLAQNLKDSISRREKQTAAGYLIFPSNDLTTALSAGNATSADSESAVVTCNPKEALYNIDQMLQLVLCRISLNKTTVTDALSLDSTNNVINSRVAFDAVVKLHIMNGRYDDALKYLLALAVHHPTLSLTEIEKMALNVTSDETENVKASHMVTKYAYVIPFIEQHHLYQNLLDSTSKTDVGGIPPLIALIRLVGLDLVGDFLIEHCVPPQNPVAANSFANQSQPSRTETIHKERRGTLPIDLVTDQIGGNPKLLLWYLHLVFLRKPDVYVKFPNTANPSQTITKLHKKQLDLYVKFAGQNRDSARALEGVEPYRVIEKSTPLLSFLKVVLHLGSIEPVEVGKMLQNERRGGATVSHVFALELAYVMEHFGNNDEVEAKAILELYLHGTQSIMLAVSYAQRNKTFSGMLWDTLVNHCLSTSKQTVNETEQGSTQPFDGKLFGSLLEAAALSGADLAKIVNQIPAGMQVEGLKPRLVAAVGDYRLKVQMHQNSSIIAEKEKLTLLREFTQRARRGVRYEGQIVSSAENASVLSKNYGQRSLKPTLHPVVRKDHFVLNYSLPIR